MIGGLIKAQTVEISIIFCVLFKSIHVKIYSNQQNKLTTH